MQKFFYAKDGKRRARPVVAKSQRWKFAESLATTSPSPDLGFELVGGQPAAVGELAAVRVGRG